MNTKKSIGIIVGVIALVLIMRFVGAAGTYPTMNPPQANPAAFLNISSTPQAKSGSLALGATAAGYNPTSILDVQGTAVVDILGSLGTGWVTQNFKVGGANPPAPTDPKLLVEGSRIRSTVLANQNEQTICADDLGRLKLCSTPPAVNTVNGACDPQTNGQMLTAKPTANLCLSGNASSVSGSGPWSWTCNGVNGGTDASCTTTSIPAVVPPTPVLVYDPNGGTGGQGPHDGIRWQPVTIPGSTTVATKYEVQTFNPAKNFVNFEWYDGIGEYSPTLASQNNWVTLGVLEYASAPAGSGPALTYQNWLSGGSWNAQIYDFNNGLYTINNQFTHNDCFSGGSGYYYGCAYRIRAINGSQYSNWSNPVVLYDAQGPEPEGSVISCETKTPKTMSVGIANLQTITCAINNSLASGTSLKLSWNASQNDNKNAPFLSYRVGVACNNQSNTNSPGDLVLTNTPIISSSNPAIKTSITVNASNFTSQSCSLFSTNSPVETGKQYSITPINDGQFNTSPATIPTGNYVYPVERGTASIN